jgi:hypothetical protein
MNSPLNAVFGISLNVGTYNGIYGIPSVDSNGYWAMVIMSNSSTQMTIRNIEVKYHTWGGTVVLR